MRNTLDNETVCYFEALSSRYEHLTTIAGAWTAPGMVSRVLLEVCDERSAILDVGVGTGQAVQDVYSRGLFFRLVGIDPSESMLEHCRSRMPRAEVFRGDITDYARGCDARFDVISCSGAFEFVTDPELFFRTCARLLKPRGFIALTYEPMISGYRPQAEARSRGAGDVGCLIHRYSPSALQFLMDRESFRIDLDEEFRSYQRSGSDVFYHLVRARLEA